MSNCAVGISSKPPMSISASCSTRSGNPHQRRPLEPRRLPVDSFDDPIGSPADVLILDSGGVSQLAERTTAAAALLVALRDAGLWPPVVLTPVLIEALHGDAARDALPNRLLKTCDVIEDIPESLARRAAALRTHARRGSAIDALVVASAEPGGSVLTSDPDDLTALATHAHDVHIETV